LCLGRAARRLAAQPRSWVPAPDPGRRPGRHPAAGGAGRRGDMIVRYYPCTLTLEAPVVLTLPGGDPNSAQSMSFIPGSAVRGAAARVLAGAGAEEFRRLILSGEVCYLNAYVLHGTRRCLPTPVSFRREKYTPSRYHDLA